MTNLKKILILGGLFIIIGALVVVYLMNKEDSMVNLITKQVNSNINLDTSTIATFDKEKYKIVLCTDQSNNINIFIVQSGEVIFYKLFRNVSEATKSIDWHVTKIPDLGEMVLGTFSHDIKQIFVNDISSENIETLNYNNSKVFLVISDSISLPVNIKGILEDGSLYQTVH